MIVDEDMDDGYFQVDRQIVNSSVWVGTDSDTKVLWLFLMFAADIRTGIVSHTIPALARDTGISRGSVEKILDLFCSPDPDSRSVEFDGRRIEYIEKGNKNGGIRILNYRKYKEKNSNLSTERVRRYRKRDETNETDETFHSVSGTKEKEKEKENKKERVNYARDTDISKTELRCTALDDTSDASYEHQEYVWQSVIADWVTISGLPHDAQTNRDPAEAILRLATATTPKDPRSSVCKALAAWTRDDWVRKNRPPITNLVKFWDRYVSDAQKVDVSSDPKELERRAVYERDTKTFEEKLKRETDQYEREQQTGGDMSSMKDVVKQLKKKSLKNL